MPNPYEALREKLSRFNQWEAERLKQASPETRLRRFLMLHDLGRSLDRHVIERRREEHLLALVASGKRLKQAASRAQQESALHLGPVS